MAPRKQARGAAKSRKKTTSGSPPEKNTPSGSPPEENDDFNLLSDDLPAGADVELKNYLEKNELLNKSYQVAVYKFEDEQSANKTFCKAYANQVPGEHEIGLQFGGGRYYVILQVLDEDGKRRGTTRTVLIHKNYDRLMNSTEAGIGAMFPVMPAISGGGNGGGGDMQNALTLMRTMMSMFMPLIQQMNKPSKNSELPAYTEMMTESMRAMNEAQKQIFLDNTQYWNDRTRETDGLSETFENEEETTGVMGTINTILPILEKVLPAFIGKPSPQTAATVDMVKNIPGYAKMIKDKKTIKRLLEYITEKHGKDVAIKVLKEFGIKKPK